MTKSFRQVSFQDDAEEGDACLRNLQASEESDDSSGEAPVWRSRNVVKGVGVSLLVAALVGTALVMGRSADLPSVKSAQHLLQSKDFHLAVKERVLKSASQNGQHDLDVRAVDEEISQSLSKVLAKLERDFPEVSEKLKGIVSEEQQKALLNLVERQHDKRLKALGEKAIKVVIENALFGPKAIRQRLAEKFRPELPELQVLYKEIVPQPIRAAKKAWYERNKKDGVDTQGQALDGGWEFLTHPNAIGIMKTFGGSANETGVHQIAERRLSMEQPLSVKLGVGITGFVLDSVNTLVIELSQLLHFKMPWWGWLLTLLPGVSLGTTSCLIAPLEKAYADFWCVDFLMFTGLQALEVTINSAWQDMVSGASSSR